MGFALVLALNFGISWLNCWSVGGIWQESKALGGWIRLVAWCAAAQSAIGFSSVIGFVAGYALYATGHLPPAAARSAASLWYLVVIVPAIGTGLVLTIQSWIVAFRTRRILDMGIAAYNTFAQVKNMVDAVSGIGEAFSVVGDLFKSDSKDDDGGAIVMLVIGLVAFALAGGVILTAVLIRRYSGRLSLPARAAAA
ncbi:hypothetical protein Bcep1808_7696 (plasmid) [Burkholderia vietnamiensis G4]|uniref:Uncharacterized protein n=1 Tax=Burkholderia vietnamiensis (strain G4 / LMG 22486) TaxID=269482 RepID=A4JWB3_BURVG|nr:hypothetical protein Bcep1808_7696 [Burkholderia vietnamiensis G4]